MDTAKVVAVVALLTACNRPGSQPQVLNSGSEFKRDVDRVPQPQPQPAAEIFEVSPQELASAYEGNELAGDARFKGKMVLVRGRVRSVERHMGDIVIIFGDGFRGRVRAYLQKSEYEEDKARSITKGRVNAVQGVVRGAGVLGGPVIDNASIVGAVQ